MGKGDAVFCLAASSSGERLVAGGKMGKVKLYRYTTTAAESMLSLIGLFDAPGEIKSVGRQTNSRAH